MSLRSGRLRHRVTFQAPNNTRGSAGGVSKGWAAVTGLEDVPAEVRTDFGREAAVAGRIQETSPVRVRTRYSTTLATVGNSHRILWGTRVLEIESVMNMNERNRELWFLCREIDRDA